MSRYFKNPYETVAVAGDFYLESDRTLTEKYRDKIKNHFIQLFQQWENNIRLNLRDTSVYTGTAGIALLYLKVYESKIFTESDRYLLKASEIVENSLKNFQTITVPTFLCGEVGLLTVAVLINYHLKKDYYKFLKIIVEISSNIIHQSSSSNRIPDEVLYGRSGYLYSLYLLRLKIPETKALITDDLIRSIVVEIIDSGLRTSKLLDNNFPLTYFWYKEAYVGAAHGYAGIFGNFPAVLCDEEDKLVHWCHGSPGLIYLLSSACKHFDQSDRYLQSALLACENIWKKGLLKKGYGLCHGTAGNGYAFLRLFSLTKDPKHLFRALKFAEWCFDYGIHGCRTPDNPFSLFEGMAGTLYYLLDLLNPLDAKFPSFQLD
ncbi:LanC-like protein 2 [Sarcoptes scabiei]|uniref:LanC-like protein 2 n=1 Tax=Sarcoptes scabiei TaxID=52283 RepID=A0A834V8T9_SARSC|nr:LanC-like protein 2 [Sarcoptes scabiei]